MNIIPFIYQDIALQESCWINGEPYFTARTIGEFLEYKYPKEAINKIVERNPHIDDTRWSTLVSLTKIEGDREVIRDVKIYNPIGLQLIVFESHQPKAPQHKIAVTNLVYAFMKGELSPVKNHKTNNLYLQCEEILKLAPYHDRPSAIKHLSQTSGKAPQTIYGMLNRIERGVSCVGRRLPSPQKGKHHSIDQRTVKEIERMFTENPRIRVKDITNETHVKLTTVYRIRRRILKQINKKTRREAIITNY